VTHLIICLDRLLDLLIFISGLTRPKGRQLTLYSCLCPSPHCRMVLLPAPRTRGMRLAELQYSLLKRYCRQICSEVSFF